MVKAQVPHRIDPRELGRLAGLITLATFANQEPVSFSESQSDSNHDVSHRPLVTVGGARIWGSDASDLRVARQYLTLGPDDAPHHLILAKDRTARSWFGRNVRHTWGLGARARGFVGRTAVGEHLAFDGTAEFALGPRWTWPLAPVDADGNALPPSVLHLGHRETAGRIVLSYLCGPRDQWRHVRIDSTVTGHVDASADRFEAAVLEHLSQDPKLSDTVPRHVANESGFETRAMAISHLDGRSLLRSWQRHPGTVRQDTDAVLSWVTRFHDASETFRPTVDPRASDAHAEAGRHLPDECHQLLQRGQELSRSHAVLNHGDLWPGNVVRTRDGGVSVLDWETVTTGSPLTDAILFIVATALLRMKDVGGITANAAEQTLGPAGRYPALGETLRRIVPGSGDLSADDQLALVLAGMHETACRPGPGGVVNLTKQDAWMDALVRVWAMHRR